MTEETMKLIDELRSGFDPSEPTRELARLEDLCASAADRIQTLAETNDAMEDAVKDATDLVGNIIASFENDPFKVLNKINVNEHVEKKNGLSYLSWAWAWQELMSLYPDSYTEINRPENGFPYWTDGKTCWVDVSVILVWFDGKTTQQRTRSEVFPVMDYKNNSVPLDKITSFQVNTALQRAWTKCIARHGLGFYIYAGEDLPKDEAEAKRIEESAPCTEEQMQKVKSLFTEEELGKMLKRMKKKNLSDVTKKEAQTMIDARDNSLVNAKVESF